MPISIGLYSHTVAETVTALYLFSFTKKGISGIKQKSEHDHWIPHIRINLATKFQLKLTILFCWIKFPQKGCFLYKTKKKMSTTIEFCIFELIYNNSQKYSNSQMAHNGKSLISVFQKLSASINKTFILEGRMGIRLSFYEV